MASYFKMISYRSGNTIYLILKGDFDGNSAWELFHLLMENSRSNRTYILNSDELNNVSPLGIQAFYNLQKILKKKNIRILVTGKNTKNLLSKNNELLDFSYYNNKLHRNKSKGRD